MVSTRVRMRGFRRMGWAGMRGCRRGMRRRVIDEQAESARSGTVDGHRMQVRRVEIRRAAGLPPDAVQVVNTTDRAAVGRLITMPEFVDVIVPRGGKSLIARISQEATVPVIKHLDGNCHVYIDDRADAGKAIAVAINAKTQRYGTCNTLETLLIAEGIADRVLPELAERYTALGVELRSAEVNLVTARRNPNLAILTVATLAGRPDIGIAVVAVWVAICLVVHALRIVQAAIARRHGPLVSWLA